MQHDVGTILRSDLVPLFSWRKPEGRNRRTYSYGPSYPSGGAADDDSLARKEVISHDGRLDNVSVTQNDNQNANSSRTLDTLQDWRGLRGSCFVFHSPSYDF